MSAHVTTRLIIDRCRKVASFSRLLPVFRVLLLSLSVFLAFSAAQKLVSFLPLERSTRAVTAALIASAAAYCTYWICVHLLERRVVIEFSEQGATKELAIGATLGAFLFTSTIGILVLMGIYRVTAISTAAVLVVPLANAIAAAVYEEILFRGIVFRVTEETLGTWLAVLLSATLFGLIHLVGPHATLLGALAIILEAGVLLAAAFIVTRRLWFPIGLHAAWNFTQGGIFGIQVSGVPTTGLFQGTLSGPAWLSGGSFGAEGSIVAILLCATAAFGLITRAKRKRLIKSPSWRARP